MQFAIVCNPTAGATSAADKARLLAAPARVLGAQVYGLDTLSKDELAACARDLAQRHDIVVVAGGDGTFSDVMNALADAAPTLAYLPLGSGNALRRALGMGGNLVRGAQRIADGSSRTVDLIRCGEKRLAFVASVGLDATVLRLMSARSHAGRRGFGNYAAAAVRAYFKEHRRSSVSFTVDETRASAAGLLNLAVVKQPYYGFGLKMVPRARFDDGQLHLWCLESGLLGTVAGVITALSTGNRMGRFYSGVQASVEFETPQEFQSDGDWRGKAKRFRFEIAPHALNVRC